MNGRSALDYTSIGLVIGWIFQILPGIATLLTVVWMLIRIWETDTVQRLCGREPGRHGGRHGD